MNQGTAKQYQEFIFRRLTEPLSLFGNDLPPRIWLLVLALVLLVGIVYVVAMYARDAVGMYRQGGGMPLWLGIPALLLWLWVPPIIGVVLFTGIFLYVRRDLGLPSWLIYPGIALFLVLPAVLALMVWVALAYFLVRPDVALAKSLFTSGVLGLLRMTVYGILAFIFLLPSLQSWQETSASSKVVVLYDISGSMTTRDDLPAEGAAFDSVPMRSDKLLAFLEDPRINFISRLNEKNPVTGFRFAEALDGNPIYWDTDGRTYTKEEYAEREEQIKKGLYVKETDKHPLASAHLREWLIPDINPNSKGKETPRDIPKADEKRYEELVARNKMLAARRFYSGTNLSDSTLNVLNRELNNMVQGIVIFTDGRSTEGSDAAYDKIAELANKAKIPIFVVGIGEVRPQVKLEISDLRAPQQVQPDDKWPIVMEITGEGLADKELTPPPEIHITYTRKKENGEVEKLKLYLVEHDEKKAAPKKVDDKPADPKPGDKPATKPADPDTDKHLEVIELSEEIILRPDGPVKFDTTSNPPRVEIEFNIDAAALAKANNPSVDLLTDPRFKGKKWDIGETKDGGEIRIQGVVAKNKLELFPQPQHKSEVLDLRVSKRPLRVLLFASAATHDFQFLNNMLIREQQQSRAEVSVYVQPPPGKDPTEWFKTVVLGDLPGHLLLKFPDKYDPGEGGDASEKFYDLSSYDAIVAFDPDWTKLNDDQLSVLKKWADKGGGLIMVGGPINTLQLARPGPYRDKLKPVLELLPVILKDVRIESLERDTKDPWPITFEDKVANDLEFLKLTEEGDKAADFHIGWNEFFNGKDPKASLKRGFFNYYPIEMVREGALIVARYADPRAQMKDGTQMPYIVVSGPGTPRVVWLAWGETRRLRQHSESFYERFWVKLLRYAGSNNQTTLAKRIRLDMSRSFTAGKFVQLDAKIDGKNGDPLFVKRDKDLPSIHLKMPAGVPDNEIPLEYKLVPRKVKDDSDKGKYSVRFQVKSPGDYQLELKVPETGDSITQKFNVKESNPELDNIRPDFNQMYRLASDAEPVLARMSSEADRQELRRHLVPPPLTKEDDKDKDKTDPIKDGKPRLYFSLKDAELIPGCMKTVTDTKQIRGKYEDIWDKGFDLGLDTRLGWFFNALALIVGLLSMEWLLRKLIRLA